MRTSEVINPISFKDILLLDDNDVENYCNDFITNTIQDNHDQEVPKVGMTLETIDEVKQFYRKYAMTCALSN